MDGVLVDFDKQAAKLFGVSIDQAQNYMTTNPCRAWMKINKAGEVFWSGMDWKDDGKELWEKIEIYRPAILSSPSNHPSSYEGKEKWLSNKGINGEIILDSEKEKYSKPDHILIDDRKKNIEKWEDAGGIGILHKNTRSTLEKLSKVLSELGKEKKQNKDSAVKNIVTYIDKLASNLEDKGLFKEAEQLDIVSNTLEYIFPKEAGKKPKGEKGDAKKRSRPNPIFDHTNSKVLDNGDHFPIDTENRARNALARANQYSSSPSWYDGSLEDLKKTVANAVKRAYPSIEVTEESYK